MSEPEKLSIKNWAEDDRPREKLLKKGILSLSDAELIAILLNTGTKNETAVDIAKRILSEKSNNLNELGKYTVDDLKKVKGIGEAKAITLLAALELGRRRKTSEIIDKKVISSSNDVYSYFQPILADLPHEEFWVLLLNKSNRIIESIKISQGGIAGTVADIRLILKPAIERLASSIVLCHNHPSGNKTPSQQDISLTKKIKQAGELFDIQVLDHIIVCDSVYYSFKDEGVI